MKNYLTTLLFSISCTLAISQYIPVYSYFLADYTAGKTDIYKIDFDENVANLTYLTSIETEVHIAYNGNANMIYAINKSGNQLRTLDLNSLNPIFGDPVDLDVAMGDITAATFDDTGTLFVGSADQNKIYTIDVTNFTIQLYDDYAPIAGGDLAFGFDGGLYLASQIPKGFYEIFPSEISPDLFHGGIPPRNTGLAAFEDGNFLFSHRNDTYLDVRSSDNTPLITQFELFLDSEPFTLHWGDLASGYDPTDAPTHTSGCEFKKTYYADYDGATTRIYLVQTDDDIQLDLILSLDFEAHIGANTTGLIFAVNTDGSDVTVIDAITGMQIITLPLNLDPGHIVAVASDENMLYIGDQMTGKIYVVNTLSSDFETVFFADAPLNGGDICFYGSELYLANKSLAKLFKYNGSGFDEVGNLPPNVTGLATFSNYEGTNAGADMIISCRGSNLFYSISPVDGTIIESISATNDGISFNLNFGDMASYCDYGQINVDMCTAFEVLDYHQGTTRNGGTISEDRTDANQALSQPEPTDDLNFVTLGYGGSIILSMGGYIQNGPGDDLEIFETSYNTIGCDAYPEFADVSISQDGVNWIYIGTVCKSENTLDISDATNLDLFQFVKIENNDDLSSTPDGFDLNGVLALHDCLSIEEDGFKSKEATDLPNEIQVSPNPGSGISRLSMVPNIDGMLHADIFDLNGRIVKSLFHKYANAEEMVETEFNSSSLPNGVYLIKMTTGNSSKVEKFIVAH